MIEINIQPLDLLYYTAFILAFVGGLGLFGLNYPWNILAGVSGVIAVGFMLFDTYILWGYTKLFGKE